MTRAAALALLALLAPRALEAQGDALRAPQPDVSLAGAPFLATELLPPGASPRATEEEAQAIDYANFKAAVHDGVPRATTPISPPGPPSATRRAPADRAAAHRHGRQGPRTQDRTETRRRVHLPHRPRRPIHGRPRRRLRLHREMVQFTSVTQLGGFLRRTTSTRERHLPSKGCPTCRTRTQLGSAPPSPGVWYGTGRFDSYYKAAVDFYKKNPAQLDKDIETVAQYKAAVQLLIENADFDGNDKSSRATKLFRTENGGVINRLPVGQGKDFPVGPIESFSVFKTVCVNGSNGTIVNVPWSRINAVYFMERTPGGKNKPFLRRFRKRSKC